MLCDCEDARAVVAGFLLGRAAGKRTTGSGPGERPAPPDAGVLRARARPSVIEAIEHGEPAAIAAPAEAAEVVAQQEAGFVEVLRDRAPAPAACGPERVFMLQLQRKPQALVAQLRAGAPLARCRAALAGAGHAWELPSGTFVFVRPDQYRAALAALETPGPRCVVFGASVEHLVEETLASLAPAGAGGLGTKGGHATCVAELVVDTETIATVSDTETPARCVAPSEPVVEVVTRTFLTWAPPLLAPGTVVQSEARSADGVNPRRRSLEWEAEP